MAGVLPGVEAARIRRFHQSNLNNGGGFTRRSSFCLYATNYNDFHITSPSSKIRRAGCEDEKLEAVAREAKQRLDRRLQTYWKIGNHKSKGNKKDKMVGEWISKLF
ncbi:hypothetical protein ACS0TY_021183 [Phlomoides rotata]